MKNKLFVKFIAVATTIVTGMGIFGVANAATPPMPSNFTGSISGTSATLSWTTPDGSLFLTDFELRYSTQSLTTQNFNIATQVAGVPAPLPGQSQSTQVSGLSEGVTYYFGIRVYNAMGQPSDIAFVTVSPGGGGGGGGTGCETPFSIMNFSASAVSADTIGLSWNTPGQALLTDFDLRYGVQQITTQNFEIATQVAGVPAPLPGQFQSTQVSGLSANTAYYFGIKVYNACGSASPFVTTSATTLAGGGGGGGGNGGGGGGGSSNPISPVSNARVIINNGADKTYSTAVTLSLIANDASQMKISNLSDVSDASWQPYTDTKPWTLTEGDGMKTVYVKYKNSNNVEGETVSDDIRLGDEPPVPQPPAPANTTTTQIIYVPVTQPQVLGVSTYRAPLDFNTLMVNWGDRKAGNYADLNGDGRVDMGDVRVLMANWVNISSNDVFIPVDNAAKFTIEPGKLVLAEGQEVMLVVNVAPGNGTKNYTARFEMYYPTDMLEYKSFTYWTDWVPVVRPDYDVVDETRGRIVKTAGMPEGFDSKRVFAVMKFIAKKTGSGSLTVQSGSYSLDDTNTDTFTNHEEKKYSELDTVNVPSGTAYQLASIISFGESGNLAAFLATFVFFLIVYVIYFFWGRKKNGREE